MANSAKYLAGTAWTSVITAALNSLADGSAAAAASAITNSTALDLLVEFDFRLGSFTPSGTPFLELHLLPLLSDGSTFADRSNATCVAVIPVTTGASAKAAITRPIQLPPGDYKPSVVNRTGVALAASGNTVEYRSTDFNLNA